MIFLHLKIHMNNWTAVTFVPLLLLLFCLAISTRSLAIKMSSKSAPIKLGDEKEAAKKIAVIGGGTYAYCSSNMD